VTVYTDQQLTDCYAANERGERRCEIRAQCIWGCALWSHWSQRREEERQ
jgi:hypothetical protein